MDEDAPNPINNRREKNRIVHINLNYFVLGLITIVIAFICVIFKQNKLLAVEKKDSFSLKDIKEIKDEIKKLKKNFELKDLALKETNLELSMIKEDLQKHMEISNKRFEEIEKMKIYNKNKEVEANIYEDLDTKSNSQNNIIKNKKKKSNQTNEIAEKEKKNLIKGIYEDNRNKVVKLFNNEQINLPPFEYRYNIDGRSNISKGNYIFLSSGLHNITIIFNRELISLKGLFKDCSNLVELDLSYLSNIQPDDTSQMFSGCKSLKKIDFSGFDTSLVTTMFEMFYGSSSLETIDLSDFNTSKVKNMNGMFQKMYSLQSLDLTNFNTNLVVDMSNMFYDLTSLRYLDLSSFNTSLVRSMYSMFYNTYYLQSLNLSNFNTSLVTDMSYMFGEMKYLKLLDIRNFFEFKYLYHSYMFYNIPNVKSVTIIFNSTKYQSGIINEFGSNWNKKDLKK